MSESPPSRESVSRPERGVEGTPYTAPVDVASDSDSSELSQVRANLEKHKEQPASASGSHGHGHESPVTKVGMVGYGIVATMFYLFWQELKKTKGLFEGGGGGGHGGGGHAKKEDHGHGGGGHGH